MDAIKFFEEANRMCLTVRDNNMEGPCPENCPLFGVEENPFCGSSLGDYWATVCAVETWSKEHPKNVLKDPNFIEFLYNHINPNDLENYIRMYQSSGIAVNDRKEE